jgi:hypothetical protein
MTGVLNMPDEELVIFKLLIGIIYLGNLDTRTLLNGRKNHLELVIKLYVLGDKLGANTAQEWTLSELEEALHHCMLKFTAFPGDSIPLDIAAMRENIAKLASAASFICDNLPFHER